jgi:Putative DNA-binding domain
MSSAVPTLLEVQHAMRRRLLDDADPVATALLAAALVPAGRLSIYRNTSRTALTNALRLNYPAVQRLVGEDFFAAAADIFITHEPPRMAWLDFYGAEFPEFLEGFDPAASLPYLPDVAWLERAVGRALHALDAAPLAPADLASVAEGDQSRVRFEPHSAVSLVSSKYPVDSIWRAVLASDDAALTAIDLSSGQVWLLVERNANGIEVMRLDEARWRFAEALFSGRSLSAALESIARAEAPRWLAEHLAAGHFGGFSLSGVEPAHFHAEY